MSVCYLVVIFLSLSLCLSVFLSLLSFSLSPDCLSLSFRFGQTGSGKTYTMEGQGPGDDSNPDRGLLYRAVETLFDVASMDVEVRTTIQISMMEVYNERIR